jgi:hypothetical protein|eukprot:SAG25_NODE_2439_length_1607_cov_1.159814_1_plen_45_part_00
MCGAGQLGGCFLGLYRRKKEGKKLMDVLKEKEKVPPDATCPIDA